MQNRNTVQDYVEATCVILPSEVAGSQCLAAARTEEKLWELEKEFEFGRVGD